MSGWGKLKLGDSVAIILGPVVAMVIGHVFAESMAAYPELGRPPNQVEILGFVRGESRFLLVCVPQIVLLLVLTLVGLSLIDTIQVLIWVGPASLGFWGGVAAWRAGLRARGVALAAIVGLAAGGGRRAARCWCWCWCCKCFFSRGKPSQTVSPQPSPPTGRSRRGRAG